MKNILIFLFGAAVGVGGTLLWLRKGIKKELEKMRKQEEIPFTVDTNEENKNEEAPFDRDPITKEDRVAYHKLINEVKSGEKPEIPIPVPPREEEILNPYDPKANQNRNIYEIDEDEFLDNHNYEKDRLVYYPGDRITCYENGTIVSQPYILIGSEWENYIGHYTLRTAYVRNVKEATDYEIYVEDGLYSDEYGPPDDFRED